MIVEQGEKLTPDAAAAMPYADAAVKEALRLAPIIAVVTRVALKTFELDGFTIPKVIFPPPPPYMMMVLVISTVIASAAIQMMVVQIKSSGVIICKLSSVSDVQSNINDSTHNMSLYLGYERNVLDPACSACTAYAHAPLRL